MVAGRALAMLGAGMRLLLPALGGYGVWLTYSGLAMGWAGVMPAPRERTASPRRLRQAPGELLARAGIEGTAGEVGAALGVVVVVAGVSAWTIFGGLLAPATAASVAVGGPLAAFRHRAEERRELAREAWPRMIEEIRLLVGAAGRSVPQALLDVGRRAPEPMRPAFVQAERVWRLSTDFERTIHTLTQQLADPTADLVCEVLLVAHQTAGSDLDTRLVALAKDRATDVRHRHDARARQAGVRFARRFVLIVPIGMAACGLSIGTGRAAYGTAYGQLLVSVGIVCIAACWVWAGRLLRLPEAPRLRSQSAP